MVCPVLVLFLKLFNTVAVHAICTVFAHLSCKEKGVLNSQQRIPIPKLGGVRFTVVQFRAE